MKAIIMAGGNGTRLKSVTGDTPKPMAVLAGKPVLEHILKLLQKNGITDVCISLRYRPEAITDYFGNGESFGMSIRYNIEKEPLGTAGGVKACEKFCGGRDFLVISGDCACDFNLKALFEAHHRHGGAVTIALHKNSVPLQYGTVLTNPKNEIVSFTEKPTWERVVSDFVNTGIYVVSPRAMALVPENTPFDFSKDLFPRLMENGETLLGIQMDGYWCDIGTPQAYYRCNLDALDGKLDIELPEMPEGENRGSPERAFDGMTHVISCPDRAALMRSLSQNLMEAGADFTNGITLNTSEGKVHIAPSPTQSSVLLSVSGNEEKLFQKYENLAKRLSGQTID